jgi:hypothetical protein
VAPGPTSHRAGRFKRQAVQVSALDQKLMAQDQKIEFHISFFAFGISEGHYVRDENYCCAKIGQNAPEGLRSLAQVIPAFGHFLAGRPTELLTAISYKLEAASLKRAVDEALFRINGFLDAYCIIKEVEAPALSPAILVRINRGLDLEAYLVRDSGWAHSHSQEGSEKIVWKEHERKMLDLMLPLFDISSGLTPHKGTELAVQIQHSAKVFRAGVKSENFGIDFLCKFVALEGLVCGQSRERKEKLLKERLGNLFRTGPQVAPMINKLWQKRSKAIHKGEFFEHALLPNSYPLQALTDDIHYLFSGTIAFALSNLDAGTVDELWTRASSFDLPDWLLKPNPSHAHRIAITLWLEDSKKVWTNMGRVTDQFFPVPESVPEAPPSNSQISNGLTQP